MKSFATFLITLFFFSLGNAQCPNGRYDQKVFGQVKATKNIQYSRAPISSGGMKNLLMDVYEPKGDSLTLRPLIIFMHGGAYWKGSKNDGSQISLGEDFAKRGYVFCSPEYRLESSPVSLLSADLMLKAVARGVQDTKSLIRFFYNSVRTEGNPYGIDTSLIFLCGSSAGAFNALHTVFLDEEDSLNNQWLQSINEVGGIYGEYDFIDFSKTIKGIVSVNGALGDKSYLDNNNTPFLSVHNTRDPQVPFNRGKPYGIETLMEVDGSNVLHSKALELGIYNPFYIIPGKDHTSYSHDILNTAVQPYFDSTVNRMKNFFLSTMEITPCDTTVTSINNYTYQKLDVFPNPTNDVFYINGIDDYENNTLSIHDITGHELYRSRLNRQVYSSKSLGLVVGTYFIQILNDNAKEAKVGKLLVFE